MFYSLSQDARRCVGLVYFICEVQNKNFHSTLAGITLSRRQAIVCARLIWLVNQFYGFTIRHYPLTAIALFAFYTVLVLQHQQILRRPQR